MRRQDRTAGKKKKEKAANRLALMGITLVVLSLAVTVHLSGISMKEKDLQYRLKEEQLEKQKSEEEQRAQELEVNRSEGQGTGTLEGAGRVPDLCSDKRIH